MSAGAESRKMTDYSYAETHSSHALQSFAHAPLGGRLLALRVEMRRCTMIWLQGFGSSLDFF